MKKIIVTIEELIAQDFVVTANSMEEAIEIAKEKYKAGEFVLLPGEVHEKKIAAYDKQADEVTVFEEF